MTNESNDGLLFHAAILHADGTFATETFSAVDDLKIRLIELLNRDVSVACYRGHRLFISKPPARYLMTPEGNIPLFAEQHTIEPDETGYLGVDPANLEDPPQLNVSRPVAPTTDEFFSDDESDAINIFDSAMPDPDT